MISVFFLFCLPLTFLSLRSLSAFSSSFYLLLFFSILIPLFLCLFQCHPPWLFRSSSPPFTLHFQGICSHCQLVIYHSFHMTGTMSIYSFKYLLKLPFTPSPTLTSSIILLETILPLTILLARLSSQT